MKINYRVLVLIIFSLTLSLAACDRDFRKPQLADPSSSPNSSANSSRSDSIAPSVGTIGSSEKHSETQVDQPKSDAPQAPSSAKNRVHDIDVSQYRFEHRNQFKTFMAARLEGVKGTIQNLKTQPQSGSSKRSLSNLEKQERKAENRLKEIERIDSSQWEQYKTSFRNEVVDLERSIQSMTSTANR